MDGGLVTTPMLPSAATHGTVSVPNDTERRPNITEDGCKIVDCRGIPLLAIPYNHVLYICVHEISMALWEKFDTPRVSVQKKITDLGIHLHQTTKAQVEILRRERIIGNFRATMITVRDAEKLYDALEYSRRKRGLVKHILKDPGKRAVRPEEFGARKLSLTVRHHQNGTPPPSSRLANAVLKQASAIAISTSPPQSHRTHGSTLAGPRHTVPRDSSSTVASLVGCALNGTPSSAGSPPHAVPRIKRHQLNSAGGERVSTLEGQEERCSYGDLLGLRFDVLFCAEDPEVLGGVAGCKDHYIELLQNNVPNKGIGSSSTSSNSGSRNSPAGVPIITIDDDSVTESSAARVRVHTHMDRNSHHRHNPVTTTRDQAQVTTPNNHSVPRHPTSTKRKSKQQDPDYQPSAYAVKSTQRNLSLSSQSKRLSRNREKDSLLSGASISSGGNNRVNSLHNRHLSSPPLELHELEEGSSVYSGVSGNSSRLQSLTPERFLFLDESSSEGEEYEQEGDRGGNSDMDSVFTVEHSSSPEMRITVPGKGSSAPDKRIVKTKLRHFAQTTSPQITAKSRGKHLPLTLDDSPPTPTSPFSPLTISIPLDQIYSYQNQSTTTALSTPYPPVPNTSSFGLSQQSAGKVHKRGRGRPSKNKTRVTALSSFVMKKRASSPSSLAYSDASVVQPPPAKRPRVRSESDSSTNDGGSRDKSSIGEGGSSSLLTAKRQFRSATGTGSTNYYSILSSSRAPGPPVSHNTCDQSDPVETIDDADEKTLNLQHQNSPNGYWDIPTQDTADNGSNLAGVNGGNPHQFLLDEDDRFSIASSTTFAPTATNHSSLTTSSKGKARTSIAPAMGGTTPGPPPPQRRGRPPKNPYSNGSNLNNELQSLISTSKSSINFDQVFGYYPPKLILKDGELQPERSLSIKRLERSAVSGLPDGHPFLSWNLGQPAKASVTLRGRGRKRKPPKAVHGTT